MKYKPLVLSIIAVLLIGTILIVVVNTIFSNEDSYEPFFNGNTLLLTYGFDNIFIEEPIRLPNTTDISGIERIEPVFAGSFNDLLGLASEDFGIKTFDFHHNLVTQDNLENIRESYRNSPEEGMVFIAFELYGNSQNPVMRVFRSSPFTDLLSLDGLDVISFR